MKNKYEIRGDVTAISLKYKNDVIETFISTNKLELANSFPNTWKVSNQNGRMYVTGQMVVNKKRIYVRLHRLVTNDPTGLDVDHINHNQLDNRDENLRALTRSENLQNRKGASNHNKSSKVRGVSWNKNKDTWQVIVTVNYTNYNIGQFKDYEKAIKASKLARAKLMPFSEEARTTALINEIDLNELKEIRSPKRRSTNERGGVFWEERKGKWCARIKLRKKSVFEKRFKNFEDATKALEEARLLLKNA